MRRDVAEFLRRYDLPPDAAAELEALLAGAPPLARLDAGATLTGVFGGRDVEPDAIASVETARGERYEDLGALGSGGMGEVRRVRDARLHRTLAMKVLHPELARRPSAMARFVEEAQATAQLQHPGIVPVHDLGRLPDGRAWFTMKEVEGRTLSRVIREVHEASGARWEPTPDGWSLQRVTSAFLAVCRAVAYAHERGVVHRDLKPANVMVGRHGEVMVLDWGLARVAGQPVAPGDAGIVRSDRSADHRTLAGQIAGTPAYMPPEQAAGEIDRVDARSDIYALGAILYEILSGRSPYEGDAGDVLAAVRSRPPTPVDAGGRLPVPPELAAACTRAMARAREDRFESAAALADEVQAWLDGSRRRDAAQAIVAAADAELPAADALRARAAALRSECDALLRDVPAWAPEEEKAAGWALADEAAALERAAALGASRREERLRAALTHAPELPEAHAALIALEIERHAAAEADRDEAVAAQAQLRLEEHLPALPPTHPVAMRAAAWLRGDGALTLITDPPGVEVALLRYEVRNRRLVALPAGDLGRTPLDGIALPMGSYLCVLRHPDRAEVRCPVHIGRGERWDGVPPEGGSPVPLRLPGREELGADDVLVPAGWFWSGDPQAVNGLPRRRLWCDDLVVRRFPVTNREYLVFLDDLVATGREDEALQHAPRERASSDAERGPTVFAYDGRRFELRPDSDGDVWQPDWPVINVTWWAARAYAAWEAARTGQPWRLPGELELEKATRGADGRRFAWGDFVDPSWVCLGPSHVGRAVPGSVRAHPVDASPYGVRGVGGNVRVWCADVYRPQGPALDGARVRPPPDDTDPTPYRVLRGGAWNTQTGHARAGARVWYTPGTVNVGIGFRLARGL